jgi:phenylpropionate dioxygenase-like ring-hydroxylating dioxygenase large terminal subunit
MFNHRTKLEHLLSPEDYGSQEFFERERAYVFGKAWQYVGLQTDLARDGDYISTDCAGVPVVVWNVGGTLRAYKNVCAHRHSIIVAPGKGNAPRLKCLYHGWEYGSEGKLTKITDGASFRGLRAADLCLRTYRVSGLGPMVFVNLTEGTPSLREMLGDLALEFDDYFGDHRLVDVWETRHAINWKIIEENAVESYHVPYAHPTTFGNFYPEERHEHRLEPGLTRYADTLCWGQVGGLQDRAVRYLTAAMVNRPTFQKFIHVHLFPNYLLYYSELISTFQIVRPLGPQRSAYIVLFFVPNRLRYGVVSRALQQITTRRIIAQLRKILLEDMELWALVQKGLNSSHHKGQLSCREERVYAFQRYIAASMLGGPLQKPNSGNSAGSFTSMTPPLSYGASQE